MSKAFKDEASLSLEIFNIIGVELEHANNNHPQFHSRHEAYAIMLEELQEAKESASITENELLKEYWKMCRNEKDTEQFGKHDALDLLCSMRNNNIDAIKELIQFGAMIEKAIFFEDFIKELKTK